MAGARQPTDLLIVKGKKHLTKAEIEERMSKEIKASADNIEPPSYLPDELKNNFTRIAGELTNLGIMSNLDCEALARYIGCEYQYQQVAIKLLKSKAIDGDYMQMVQLQEKLFKMARTAASDLGLTISSRCKLTIPKAEKDDKPESKWAKFNG